MSNRRNYQQVDPNSSTQSLEYGKKNVYQNSQQKEFREERKRAKKDGIDHLYKQNYQPAKFKKAEQFRDFRSYKKKLPSGHYRQLDLYANTEELKSLGLGVYFYIEFFRRLVWLFFFMTILECLNIYINWKGDGLAKYSESFSTYLIKSTVGNYSGDVLTGYDVYILTITPAFSFLLLWIVYLVWKCHFSGTIDDDQENRNQVKPEKFCLEVEGVDETYLNQEQLERFFSSFGPVFEISLVRRHKNQLEYFQQLDEIEEQIKQEELEVILGSGDKQHIKDMRKQKQKLNKYINTLKIQPKTVSVYVHFQFQKSKVDCLTYFNNHYLFNTCSHGCMRNCCCCCVPEIQPKYLLKGQPLFVKEQKVPSPDDINWGHFELSAGSKFCRFIFAGFIILIFLVLSCSIIGLCSVYISSHSSNCDNITVPTTYADASALTDAQTEEKRCYCNANLVTSFSDDQVKTFCESYLTEIYIQQGIQYAVIFSAAFMNWLFGFIVDKLVNCIRPESKSDGLKTKTTIYTLFLIFNSIAIPLLIYGDILGFRAANYVSLLTVISTDVKNLLQVQNLSFYPGFEPVWYRNVSPIFTGFIVINTLTIWLFWIIEKYISNKDSLRDEEGKILQKHMNEQITSYKLDIYKEASNFYLVLVMVCLFHTGIPALIPLGFINFFSRYTANRSLLQNNSSKIEGLGQQFIKVSYLVLAVCLIFGPLIGQWMLVENAQIYPNGINVKLSFLDGSSPYLEKQLYLPFYIIIAFLAFVQYFLYNTLLKCCSWMCSLCYEKKKVVHPYHTRPFSEYSRGMNILYSYNIKNNDEMRNAILNLEKYLIDKER